VNAKRQAGRTIARRNNVPTGVDELTLQRSLSCLLITSCVFLAIAWSCSRSGWEYPVRLGDARERVYDLVGAPTARFPDNQNLSVTEWFPTSGVSIEFDQFGKARQLNVAGEFHWNDWVQSGRHVVFGLTSRSTWNEFVSSLGQPVSTGPVESGYQKFSWHKGEYAIAGEFWVEDSKDGDHVYPMGTLKWLEVSSAQ